jgi:hypothetical protein
MFVSIGFADDHFFSQLQMADFLASIMRTEAEHRFFGTPFDMRQMYDLFAEPSTTNGLTTSFLGSEVLKTLVLDRRSHMEQKRRRKRADLSRHS